MKVNIGAGQLFRAFRNARKALCTRPMLWAENIKLFEQTYDIKVIDNHKTRYQDQLIFKSETDYFAFLMRWS